MSLESLSVMSKHPKWYTKMQEMELSSLLFIDPINAVHADQGFLTTRHVLLKTSSLYGKALSMKSKKAQLATFQMTWSVLLERYLRNTSVCFITFLPEQNGVCPVWIQSEYKQSMVSIFQYFLDFERDEDDRILSYEELIDGLGADQTAPPFNTALGFGMIKKDIDLAGQLKCDLILNVQITEDTVVEVTYNSHKINKQCIDNLIMHLDRILETWMRSPLESIDSIELLTLQEQKPLLMMKNGESVASKGDMTVHKLIRMQCKQTPLQAAIIAAGDVLTYDELDQAANQLAGALLESGIGSGDCIAVLACEDTSVAVAALGILKAGAVCVPIDAGLTHKEVEFLLHDCEAKGLLVPDRGARDHYLSLEYTGEIIIPEEMIGREKSKHLVEKDRVAPSDLACIIYKKGEDGKPQGVMIEHQSLVNRALWLQSEFKVSPMDHAAVSSVLGGGSMISELLGYLCSGAKVNMIPREIHSSVEQLNSYYDRHGISIAYLPSSLCDSFVRLENSSLRMLFAYGQRFRSYQVQSYHLYECYTSVEIGGVVSWQKANEETTRKWIGRPIPNTQFIVIDGCGHPQPAGIPGELCIAGIGLARGYLGQPEMTEERFVQHPLRYGHLMFRTGEQACMHADGSIELLTATS